MNFKDGVIKTIEDEWQFDIENNDSTNCNQEKSSEDDNESFKS